ncbi:hypothetical protein LguiB_015403 [Lonicera macranthoides]
MDVLCRLDGTQFKVVVRNEKQVEVSFSRTWNGGDGLPLNSDKRFVMLCVCPGFYTYNILERPEGWPDVDIAETKIAFKLQDRLFHYMAISGNRQKIMPSDWDRQRGTCLDYAEAVLLTNPGNPTLNGQLAIETRSWPYDFPYLEDYPHADQRGTVTGRLQVRDWYINQGLMNANYAYVGLAPPGAARSFQRDTKGYQYWNHTNDGGYFFIRGVRAGTYNLYAWVPGFIGDYRYNVDVTIAPGEIKLDDPVYEPPRNGPTLWEVGIPDRTAVEFYSPNPKPSLRTQLTRKPDNSQKFRQYGLLERYTDRYPNEDLVYDVARSDYQTDWFFAYVIRKVGNNTYEPTTWRIVFDLKDVARDGTYTFQQSNWHWHLRTKLDYSCDVDENSNKPDFQELDLGSPVSPLRIHPAGNSLTTTINSSSISSGSFFDRNPRNLVPNFSPLAAIPIPAPNNSDSQRRHFNPHTLQIPVSFFTSFFTPQFGGNNISAGGSGFEDEPPLLKELGPFLFLMAFGLFQLLAGKLHFGIILGWVTVEELQSRVTSLEALPSRVTVLEARLEREYSSANPTLSFTPPESSSRGLLRLLMSTEEAALDILPTTGNLSERMTSLANPTNYQAVLEGFSGGSSQVGYVAEVARLTSPDWMFSGYNPFDYSSSDLSTILNFGADDLQILSPFLMAAIDGLGESRCVWMEMWLMLGSITIAAAGADGPNGVYFVDSSEIIFCGET